MEKVEMNSTQSMSTIHSFASNGCVCVCVSVHLFRFENLSFSRIWPPSQLVELTKFTNTFILFESIRIFTLHVFVRWSIFIVFFLLALALAQSLSRSLYFALYSVSLVVIIVVMCLITITIHLVWIGFFSTFSRFVRNFNHRCDLVW